MLKTKNKNTASSTTQWIWLSCECKRVCFLVHSDLCSNQHELVRRLLVSLFVHKTLRFPFVCALFSRMLYLRFNNFGLSAVLLESDSFHFFSFFCGNRISYKFVCFDWITKAVFTVCLICFFFLFAGFTHGGSFCSKVKIVTFDFRHFFSVLSWLCFLSFFFSCDKFKE